MKVILIKHQTTGGLLRVPIDTKLPSKYKKVVGLAGRDICKKDGSLIDSFYQVEFKEIL